MTIMVWGFGLCGVPDCFIKAIRNSGGMTLIELADGVTVDEIKARTGAQFATALDGAGRSSAA